MNWELTGSVEWTKEIDNRPEKEEIARQLAERAESGNVIGIGSGSTAYLAVIALADRIKAEGLDIKCVATSYEAESYCVTLGLPVTTLNDHRPDWCFDGADEIDGEGNMIKGRGGAFVREQLVFAAAKERIILADPSKIVSRLGEKFSVPLGVVPEAANLVRNELKRKLGTVPEVRPAGGKDGGVINEQSCSVMDLPIDGSLAPAELERLLLTTPGISATGLFIGYEYELLK